MVESPSIQSLPRYTLLFEERPIAIVPLEVVPTRQLGLEGDMAQGFLIPLPAFGEVREQLVFMPGRPSYIREGEDWLVTSTRFTPGLSLKDPAGRPVELAAPICLLKEGRERGAPELLVVLA